MAKYSNQALTDAFNKLSAPVVKSLKKKIEDYLKTCDPAVRKCFYYDYKAHDQGDWFEELATHVQGSNVWRYVYFHEYLDGVSDKDFSEAFDRIVKIIKSEKAPFKFEVSSGSESRENGFFIIISKEELAKKANLQSEDELDEHDLETKISKSLNDNYNKISSELKKYIEKYEYLYISDRFNVIANKNSSNGYSFNLGFMGQDIDNDEDEEFMASEAGEKALSSLANKFKSTFKKYLPSYFKLEPEFDFAEFYFVITIDTKDKDKLVSYVNESGYISYLDKVIFESANI